MTPRMKYIALAINSEAMAVCATGVGALSGVRWGATQCRGAMPNSLDAPEWIAAGSVEATHTLVFPRVTAIERGAA